MNKGFSIAIDGPVASGKGTIAPILAQKLNGIYLDTGAMYRCVALYLIENNLNVTNSSDIDEILSKIKIDIAKNNIFLNNKDVTQRIRDNDVDVKVPEVAGIKEVREFLVLLQKQIAEKYLQNGITFIAEGRDIATHVLPNANLKIFLTADLAIRARRRYGQYNQENKKKSLDQVVKETKERDERDISVNKTLVVNPQNWGYLIIDDSNLSKDETIELIIKKVSEVKND